MSAEEKIFSQFQSGICIWFSEVLSVCLTLYFFLCMHGSVCLLTVMVTDESQRRY